MNQEEKQFEIDFAGLANYLKKRIAIVLAAVLVFAVGGFLYSETFIKPVYVAETQLYVFSRSSTTAANSNDFLLSDQILKDCHGLITCKAVTKEVVDQMNLKMSPNALAGKISVSSLEETRILRIAVSDGNPNRAANIANKVCEVASKLIQEKMDLPAVHQLYEADVPTGPSGPNSRRTMFVAAVIGLVLSTGILTVIFALDDSIRTEEDVERYLGLSVLGVIPDSRNMDTSAQEHPVARKKRLTMPKRKGRK